MTTVTIDNIPDTKKAEYQTFFRTLVREYDLEELEDKLLGLHMSHNDESSLPIASLKNKYASRDLLELVDEAKSGTLTEKDLAGHKITMDSLRKTIMETPSSLKMVDMSIYESWLEKIK